MSQVAAAQAKVVQRRNRTRSPVASDSAPQNGMRTAAAAMDNPTAALYANSLAPWVSTTHSGKKKVSIATAKKVLARSYNPQASSRIQGGATAG